MNAPVPFPAAGEIDPALAGEVAALLRMIADGLIVTAQRPVYGPLVKRRVDDTVQHLIDLSDWLSGDCDLESSNDDEPSLGWASIGPRAWDASDDREQDVGDEPEARDPDFEQTALETAGRGFPNDRTRDDDEDGHDQEAVGEREGCVGS